MQYACVGSRSSYVLNIGDNISSMFRNFSKNTRTSTDALTLSKSFRTLTALDLITGQSHISALSKNQLTLKWRNRKCKMLTRFGFFFFSLRHPCSALPLLSPALTCNKCTRMSLFKYIQRKQVTRRSLRQGNSTKSENSVDIKEWWRWQF